MAGTGRPLKSRCVLARENRGTFLAIYVARVRITVHAGGATTIREGHGTGEGRGTSPGEVHDIALKAAETDATKRALSTFGKPFGLALYGKRKQNPPHNVPAIEPKPVDPDPTHISFARDDTTPIPRPSRYYGRRQDPVSRDLASRTRIQSNRHDTGAQSESDTSIVPPSPDHVARPDRQERSRDCRAQTPA